VKGLGWEDVCGDLLDRCEQLGLLAWHRFSVPVKQLGKRGPGGRFVAVYAAKAPPDLLIVLRGTFGQAILADWKDCAAPPWSLSAIPAHQANAFESMVKAGGRGLVLLRVHQGTAGPPVMLALDWSRIRVRYRDWATGKCSGSLTLTEARSLGREFRGYVDLCNALEAP